MLEGTDPAHPPVLEGTNLVEVVPHVPQAAPVALRLGESRRQRLGAGEPGHRTGHAQLVSRIPAQTGGDVRTLLRRQTADNGKVVALVRPPREGFDVDSQRNGRQHLLTQIRRGELDLALRDAVEEDPPTTIEGR